MRPGRLGPAVGALVLGLLAGAASGRAVAPHLFRIPTDDPVALERYAKAGLAPVRVVAGWALAWGAAGPSAAPSAMDLGERRTDRSYAVVYVGAGDAGRLGDLGRVLWRDGRIAILEYPPDRAGSVWTAYPILPIPDRPVRFARTSAPLRRARLQLDPVVAAYVSRVDSSRMKQTVLALQDFGSRRSDSPGGVEAGAFVHDRFLSCGLSDVTDFAYDAWCPDVVAVQPGLTNPREMYVICGHYDSISRSGSAPGADDNGSGTAGVLEAARLLSQDPFEATICYVAFSGEEQGLVGSENWVAHAVAQGLDIRGVLNLDMIGYLRPGDPADLDVISDAGSTSLRDLAFGTVGLYLPEFAVVDGAYRGGNSDQQSFWDAGLPALSFFEDSNDPSPFWHTDQDLVGPSLNDLGFFKKNVQSAVALLATLARPLRVRISYTPPAEVPVGNTDYRISARIESGVSLWTDSLFVRYRVNGGPFTNARMAAADDSNLYAAEIPRQPPGTLVEYSIHAQDVEGHPADAPPDAPAHLFSFVVGFAAVFDDNFETDLGWTVGAPGDSATTGIWERGAPVGTGAQPGQDATGDSVNACYFTGNGVPGGGEGDSDVDGGRTTLTSPRIDLAGLSGITLDFARWYVDETYNDDTLRVLLSNDDGASWLDLEAVTRSERAWKRIHFDSIDRLLPPTDRMRLRFVAEDVGRPSLVEVAIDDVRFSAVQPRVVPPRSSLSSFVQAAPNPFRTSITLVYDLETGGAVDIAIYDAAGRRVTRLYGGVQPAGRHEITWDGTTAARRRACSGLYLARLQTGEPRFNTARILLLR